MNTTQHLLAPYPSGPERQLAALVAQYDLPIVLRAMARVMADMGCVTSGMVAEIAAIEHWIDGESRAGRTE